jgi:hypothetical protein
MEKYPCICLALTHTRNNIFLLLSSLSIAREEIDIKATSINLNQSKSLIHINTKSQRMALI